MKMKQFGMIIAALGFCFIQVQAWSADLYGGLNVGQIRIDNRDGAKHDNLDRGVADVFAGMRFNDMVSGEIGYLQAENVGYDSCSTTTSSAVQSVAMTKKTIAVVPKTTTNCMQTEFTPKAYLLGVVLGQTYGEYSPFVSAHALKNDHGDRVGWKAAAGVVVANLKFQVSYIDGLNVGLGDAGKSTEATMFTVGMQF